MDSFNEFSYLLWGFDFGTQFALLIGEQEIHTRNNKKGFTLIELLIVIGIIAVITAIALPSLFRARRTSNETAALATIKQFSTGAFTYSSDNAEGQYWSMWTPANNFSPYFNHVPVKSGYRFYYYSSWDRYHFIYLAIPISTSTGTKAFYVDEAFALWVADMGEEIPDYSGSHIDWTIPPGVMLEDGSTRLELGEYLMDRK